MIQTRDTAPPRAWLLLFLALLSLAPLAAPAAQPMPAAVPPRVEGADAMAAHRAAYRLTLDRARDNSDLAQARGAMLFEVVDACEGWATRQRFTMTLTDRDGNTVETTSDYSTFEQKDGRRLRFSLVQTSQGNVTQRISGEAELDGEVGGVSGGGVVRYVEPQQREEKLPPGTLLPMIHTIRALAAARAGQRLFITPLFDGTSDDGAQDSTTAIAGWTEAVANERFPALSPFASARMRVAFFSRGQGSGGASAPEYEVGLRYFENGVADELKMDFGDFIMDGRLERLEILPGGC